MKIIKITFFTLGLFFTLGALAQTRVDVAEAWQVAQKFYYERAQAYTKIDYNQIKAKNHEQKFEDDVLLYHVFQIVDGGYVIVSGSKRVQPVLAYSFESHFENALIAPNFRAWMRHYEAQIVYVEQELIQAASKVATEWQRLLSGDLNSIKDFSKQKAVLPLISSRWNQGNYYNGLCPEDPSGPGGRAYAGCVATAMGQLMYYHRWPIIGTGAYTYQHDVYGTIEADFENTTYDWESMPNSITRPNKAIAELLFHMGVAVDMRYGPNGSGMWNHSAARSMRNYFKYGPETEYIFRDSTTLAWDSILVANLDNKKPLYYAGWTQNLQDSSGHAFICDGYQGLDYYHFDWGWGGAFNGYFYLHQLTPGGANFNFRQEVIKDVYPDTLNYTYPLYCSGHRVLTEFVGSIEDGSGIQQYQNNAYCSWLIAPELFVNNITLSFDEFDTEAGFDFVRVYNGEDSTATLLGEFSGSNLPQNVTSSANRMFVTFTTNDSITGKGFKATYSGALPTYCSPLTLFDKATDTIRDGSGAYSYNYFTNCRWRIQPPNAQSITLEFSAFDIDENVDYLEIYDFSTSPVSLVDTYTGDNLPPTKTYNTGILMLWFKANTFSPKSGWEVVYSSSATSIETHDTHNLIAIFPNPAQEYVNIHVPNGNIAGIEVYSIDGKLLYDFKGKHDTVYKICVKQWHKGLYITKIETETQTTFKKLIIH